MCCDTGVIGRSLLYTYRCIRDSLAEQGGCESSFTVSLMPRKGPKDNEGTCMRDRVKVQPGKKKLLVGGVLSICVLKELGNSKGYGPEFLAMPCKKTGGNGHKLQELPLK